MEGLCRLMPPDHLFVDSLGIKGRGREPMREGWRAYFAMSPDYHIAVTDYLETDHQRLDAILTDFPERFQHLSAVVGY